MSFAEIIGQESAIALLKRVFLTRRIAHAYVFVGPDGVGKSKTALKFAQLLVCEKPIKEAEPCGHCAACLKAKNSNHPDIQCLNPDGQYVKIDAVREACRRLSLKGFESKFKVLIIPQAQYLNEEASNALLKTLEEPASDSVIILIAPALKNILPTIASRCQRIVFSALGRICLEKLLSEKFSVAVNEAGYLAAMSAGSLGRALSYHDSGLYSRKNALIKGGLDSSYKLDDFVDFSKDERSSRDEKIKEALCVLSSWFRDLLVAKVALNGADFINADRKNDIIRASKDISLEEIEAKIATIAESWQEISRNVYARISLTRMRVELWKQ